MNTILQKRIEEAAKSLINYNLVDLGDLVNQYDLRRMLIEMGIKVLQNQWISVEEAFPEEGDMVFVTGGHHRTLTAIYYKETGFVSSGIVLSSTHWMPIPQLKGGEK